MRLVTMSPDGEFSMFDQSSQGNQGREEDPSVAAIPNDADESSGANPDSFSENWDFPDPGNIDNRNIRIIEPEDPDRWVGVRVDATSSQGGNNGTSVELSIPGDDSLPSDIGSLSDQPPHEVDIHDSDTFSYFSNREKLDKWFSKWWLHSFVFICLFFSSCFLCYRSRVNAAFEKQKQEAESWRQAYEAVMQRESEESSSWSTLFQNCFFEANVRPGSCYSGYKQDASDLFDNFLKNFQDSFNATQAWEELKMLGSINMMGDYDSSFSSTEGFADAVKAAKESFEEFKNKVHEEHEQMKTRVEAGLADAREKSQEGVQNFMAGISDSAASIADFVNGIATALSEDLFIEDDKEISTSEAGQSDNQLAHKSDSGVVSRTTQGVLAAGLATAAAAASASIFTEWIAAKFYEEPNADP